MARGRKSLLVALGVVLCAPRAVVAESAALWVIVNNDSPAGRLGRDELALIYTASKRSWANGDPIIAFNSPPKTSARERFDQAVLNMSPEEAGRYWVQQRVRGHARPPRIAPSARVAVSIVMRLTNSIAYVHSPQAPAGVRVVAVVMDGKVKAWGGAQ